MTAAVLLPASFIALGAEWFFLAEADRLHPAGVHAGRDEGILDGVGALVAERDVVLGRAALVAVALNGDVHAGVLAQEAGVCGYDCLLIAAKISLVIVKVNVFDSLIKEVFFRDGRLWRRRRWRLGHGKARRSFLRTSRTFGDQVVRDRVGRVDGLRSAGLHRTDAVNRDVGGVAGLPRQGRRLSGLNAGR